MKAPGSPSSALTITYLGSPGAFRDPSHLRPAGKPAPPRPRMLDFLTSASTASGPISNSAFASAE